MVMDTVVGVTGIIEYNKMSNSDKYVLTQDFGMYQNHDDITTMNSNSLAYGSKNVLITGDETKVIESRNGYTMVGSESSGTTPIRSKYDDYINSAGVKLWFREYGTNTSNIEVYYKGTWYPFVTGISSHHESYFTEWQNSFDGINHLIWVNGTNSIKYWLGGISSVSSVTANTIVFDDNIINSLQQPGGTVVMNGVTFTYTGISGQTLTGVAPSPVGTWTPSSVIIVPHQTTTLELLGQPTTTPDLDICGVLENHVWYGNYKNKTIWVSWSRDAKSSYTPTEIVATFDNLIVSGTYTGTIKKKVCIDTTSITEQDKQSYTVVSTPSFSYTGIYTIPTRGKFKTVVTSVVPGISITVDYYFQPDYTLPFSGSPSGTFTFNTTNIGSSYDLGGTGIKLFVQNIIGSVTPQDTYLLEIGGADQYSYKVYDDNKNIIQTGSNIPMNNLLIIDGVTFSWNKFTGHTLGDKWCYTLYPEVVHGFADIYHDDPRKATQGFVHIIDSPPVAMIQQEGKMYFNSRNGIWTTAEFKLAAENGNQTILFNRLKSEYANKALRQSLMCHAGNDVLFVTIDNTVESLGRVTAIDTPQTKPISNQIKIDMKNSNFTPYEDGTLCGSLDFVDNKLFVTVPLDGLVYIYDFVQGGWQPPQEYPITSVSIINGLVCGHSSFSNETYNIFNSSNDNGQPFKSVAVFPYNSYGYRYDKKSITGIYTEGYKNNQSNLTVHFWKEYGGCEGKIVNRLDPEFCQLIDRASLGKSQLGYHGLGNDDSFFVDKFRTVTKIAKDCWYESSIKYEQDSIDGYFRLIAVGVNATGGECSNSGLCKLRRSPEPEDYIGVPGTDGYSNYINPGSSHLYSPNTGGPVTPGDGPNFGNGGPVTPGGGSGGGPVTPA